MSVDVTAAARFLAAHGRVLDRRRFDMVTGTGTGAEVLGALEAYRNADGGYGWGLEPDLRSPESQPIHALHAFETMHECASTPTPTSTPRAAALCDWLTTVTFDDGGIPFVMPITDATACAPWFAGADTTASSFHGTLAVTAAAARLAHHDPDVAAHPWLAEAIAYCLRGIAQRTERDEFHAYELVFSLRLLDALHTTDEEAAQHLPRLAALIPPSGALPVTGGLEDEYLRPLDYAPEPTSAVRAYLSPDVVDADLDRLASGQQADGGWVVDFASFSPAATLEWRGYATVRAVTVLAAHGLLG